MSEMELEAEVCRDLSLMLWREARRMPYESRTARELAGWARTLDLAAEERVGDELEESPVGEVERDVALSIWAAAARLPEESQLGPCLEEWAGRIEEDATRQLSASPSEESG